MISCLGAEPIVRTTCVHKEDEGRPTEEPGRPGATQSKKARGPNAKKPVSAALLVQPCSNRNGATAIVQLSEKRGRTRKQPSRFGCIAHKTRSAELDRPRRTANAPSTPPRAPQPILSQTQTRHRKMKIRLS